MLQAPRLKNIKYILYNSLNIYYKISQLHNYNDIFEGICINKLLIEGKEFSVLVSLRHNFYFKIANKILFIAMAVL